MGTARFHVDNYIQQNLFLYERVSPSAPFLSLLRGTRPPLTTNLAVGVWDPVMTSHAICKLAAFISLAPDLLLLCMVSLSPYNLWM